MKLALCAAAVLALAGCKQQQSAEDTKPSEVLPGVSDAMIPYDTLRSQPPLAPVVEASGAGGSRTTRRASNGGSEAASEASGDTPAADAAPKGGQNPQPRAPQPSGAAPQ